MKQLTVRAQVNLAYNTGVISAIMYAKIRSEAIANPTDENKHYFFHLKALLRERKIGWYGLEPRPEEIN